MPHHVIATYFIFVQHDMHALDNFQHVNTCKCKVTWTDYISKYLYDMETMWILKLQAYLHHSCVT